jgi:hypothetical protein
MENDYGILEYDSNNSGGDWWLADKDWYAMEKDGWAINWFVDEEHWSAHLKDGRWLDALASKASIPVASLQDAKDKIRQWEKTTKQRVTDLGCSCCGQPHNFYIRKPTGEWEDPIDITRTVDWK